MSKNERRSELSLMNVLLCLFVIYIHAASTVVSQGDRSSWQYAVVMLAQRGASCAVPGFFFLAAVKTAFGLNKPFSYPKYLLGRVKRVVLPYIIACAVYCVFFIGHNYMIFDIKAILRDLAIGQICGHFYFVIAIVQFYLLVPIWRFIARRLDSGVRVATVLIASYFISQIFGQYSADFLYIFDQSKVFAYADRIFTTYLFWWMLGLAVGRNYGKVVEAVRRDFLPTTLFFAFAALTAGYLDYMHFTGKASIWWLESAHTFYIFAAICFIFALSNMVSCGLLTSLTAPVDRASYQVYLWHVLCLYVADIVNYRLGLTLMPAFISRLIFGCIPIIVAYVVWIVRKLIKR